MGKVPSIFGVTPLAIERRHSRNLACAARSWVKEFVRCSSSSSSCFFTWLSCAVVMVARSTGGFVSSEWDGDEAEGEGREEGWYWIVLLGRPWWDSGWMWRVEDGGELLELDVFCDVGAWGFGWRCLVTCAAPQR